MPRPRKRVKNARTQLRDAEGNFISSRTPLPQESTISDNQFQEDLNEIGDDDANEIWIDGELVTLPNINNALERLKWNEDAEKLADGRQQYRGNSARTLRRHRDRKQAALASSESFKKIHDFFPSTKEETKELEQVAEVARKLEEMEKLDFQRQKEKQLIAERLESLKNILYASKSSVARVSKMNSIETRKLQSVYHYLLSIRSGKGKEKAASDIAQLLWDSRKSYYPKIIAKWTKTYLNDGILPFSMQGKHSKSASILSHEDIQKSACKFLRESPRANRSALKLKQHLENIILPTKVGPGTTVSESTVLRFMKKWGFEYKADVRSMYVDGHERDDVVEYRKGWSQRMMDYRKRMRQWEGENMEILIEPKDEDVQLGKVKELVMVTHDESTFYANDDRVVNWKAHDESYIKKKGPGLSIMVSDFLCACHGSLKLDEQTAKDLGIPARARDYLEAGKNREGYWRSEDMVKAVEKAVIIFEHLHPGCQGLFVFDQSTNHNAYSSDALVVNRMTWFSKPKGDLNFKDPSMFFQPKENGPIHFKGVKQVN